MDCPDLNDLVDYVLDKSSAPWVAPHLFVCEECRDYFDLITLIKTLGEEDGFPSWGGMKTSENPEERLAYRWMLHWDDFRVWTS